MSRYVEANFAFNSKAVTVATVAASRRIIHTLGWRYTKLDVHRDQLPPLEDCLATL